MTALATLTAILTTTIPPWDLPTEAAAITGSVTRYDPGLMEIVAVNRGIITDVSQYDAWLAANRYSGMIALERAGDLGRDVWIGGERYFVADCRAKHHYPGGHVAEVGYKTAKRWLAVGEWPREVVVRFAPDMSGWRYRPE